MLKNFKLLTVVALIAAALAGCAGTYDGDPTSGPNYDAVFETKHGVVLTARATEQAVYQNGAVQQVAATQYLIRERGTGEMLDITTLGVSDVREGDAVVVVYGPETRVVHDN